MGWGLAHSRPDSPAFPGEWLDGQDSPVAPAKLLGRPGEGLSVMGLQVTLPTARTSGAGVVRRGWALTAAAMSSTMVATAAWSPCTWVWGPGVVGWRKAGEDRLPFSPGSTIEVETPAPAVVRCRRA